VFGLGIPAAVPGVPPKVLNPRETWADPAAYDVKARELAGRFADNFAQYVDLASEEVRSVGPDPHA
jgi:phosphoenolpyruvate carboxykinase (ATP)